MLNSDPNPICGVLYVDDEEKALKYFRLAFSSKYRVFTASSAEEGIEMLRRESAGIGIVLSDQRMPNVLGSQFLGMVREEYPRIVRILTTAYTGLSDAIEAVNTGHIYQYVTKPCEVSELGMVLQRAADYFQVLTERNELLAVKMTTLQRIVCSDRLKWLLVWSRSLPADEQAAFRRALAAFVRSLPLELNPLLGSGETKFSARQFEITGLLQDEYRNAVACLDALDAFRAGAWDPALAVQNLALAIGETPGDVTVETSPENAARLTLPVGKAVDLGSFSRRLFGLLIEREAPTLSLQLFQTLLSLARVGGSLEISSADGAFKVGFFPATAENEASEVIQALAEKFSAADISRL